MKTKKIFKKTVRIILIFIITAAAVGDFSLQFQRLLQTETDSSLTEVSSHYNVAFLERIENHIRVANILADSLTGISDLTQDEITVSLQSAVKGSGFSRVALSDTNGISLSHDGITVDISDREYFKKAMQGSTVVSQPLISAIDNEKTIVIAVPMRKNEETTGILLGMYPLSIAGNQLLDKSHYGGGYGFIVSPNGDILLAGKNSNNLCDEDNLFLFFNKTTFTGLSQNDVEAAIKRGEKGSFTYTYQGEKRFANFMPSGINDWYTISIAPDLLIRQQKDATNILVFQLVLKLAAIGAILMALFMLNNRRHSKEIIKANQRYLDLINNINGGVILTTHSKESSKTTPLYVSDGFIEITGYTIDDINSIYNGVYIGLIHPDDLQPMLAHYTEQIATKNTYSLSYRIIKKDGSILWVMDTGNITKDGYGGFIDHSILSDISLLKQQEEELRLADERFRIALMASHATLFEIDLQTKAYLHFENADQLLGASPAQLMANANAFADRSLPEYLCLINSIFFHPDDSEVVENALSAVFNGHSANFEARMKKADGSYVWCKTDMGIIKSKTGEPIRAVGYITDISSIKHNTEILENKALIDSLTGLYNKATTVTLVDEILSTETDTQHALIVLDIDNFKGVNDTLGHAFGDSVLMDVCEKLKTLFRSDDIVGRIGGDEFAILMKNVPNTTLVFKKAAEICGAFRQTYSGEHKNYKISCSVGIIMCDNKNDSFETLLPKVDSALYHAKRSGKDMFVLYHEEDAKNYPTANPMATDLEIQNVKEHWNIEERIFELMYNSKHFADNINIALSIIGQQYHVSRAYVFENDSNNEYICNIYEWCNQGITPAKDSLQNLKISHGENSIFERFDEDGMFYCNDVRTAPSYTKQTLETLGVLSTLQMQVVHDGNVGGFIGFDECNEYRAWTADEIHTLAFLSKILSVFLLKARTDTILIENLNSRLTILNSLPEYICIINPETHSIEYTNDKMQSLLPAAQNGALCHIVLRGGQNSPCETCLVERIKRGDTNNLEIISENKKMKLKVEALYIDWFNHQKVVLLYGQEPAIKL